MHDQIIRKVHQIEWHETESDHANVSISYFLDTLEGRKLRAEQFKTNKIWISGRNIRFVSLIGGNNMVRVKGDTVCKVEKLGNVLVEINCTNKGYLT